MEIDLNIKEIEFDGIAFNRIHDTLMEMAKFVFLIDAYDTKDGIKEILNILDIVSDIESNYLIHYLDKSNLSFEIYNKVEIINYLIKEDITFSIIGKA